MEFLGEAKTTIAFLERNFALVKRYLGWEIVFVTYSVVNSLCILFIGVTQGKEMVMYLAVGASSNSARNVSTPTISGMRISTMNVSKPCSCCMSSAAAPLSAAATSYPDSLI